MANKKGKILIVDDNQDVLDSLELFLDTEFDEVKCVRNPNLILSNLKKKIFDAVLLDMNFSAGINTGNEGIYWLREILKESPELIVIPITAYGDINLAVKAVKEGAFDFVTKPWDNDKLLSTIKAGIELRDSKREIANLEKKREAFADESHRHIPTIIGNSAVMKQIKQLVSKVAPTEANILITGENGTGKEVLAKEIYRQSERKNEPFVSVDLGSITETLFESELFGHMKGSFTDAKKDKTGRLEMASGGTLFLDEIGNIPMTLQSKLLSVLQNREIFKVGASSSTPIDIRLICATNCDLNRLVDEGKFRADLLYRINTIHIELPALRERTEDIPELIEHFITKHSAKYRKDHIRVTSQASQTLLNYAWPGNIRELEHTIEKAMILSEGKLIGVDDLALSKNIPVSSNNLKEILTLEEIEKQAILDALNRNRGNLTEAAKELNTSRQTIYNKMNKYNI